jgi:hypothetical protein
MPFGVPRKAAPEAAFPRARRSGPPLAAKSRLGRHARNTPRRPSALAEGGLRPGPSSAAKNLSMDAKPAPRQLRGRETSMPSRTSRNTAVQIQRQAKPPARRMPPGRPLKSPQNSSGGLSESPRKTHQPIPKKLIRRPPESRPESSPESPGLRWRALSRRPRRNIPPRLKIRPNLVVWGPRDAPPAGVPARPAARAILAT